MADYCYVMKGLTKTVPGGDTILEDIWLSFFPGAKIGVVGPNGAGKSTLLRIMAGLDDDHQGEAWAADGYTVGHLPQEPTLDEDEDVRGNIMAGLGEAATLVSRYNELAERLSEPLDDDEMAAVYDEMAAVQDKIDAADAWDLDRHLDIAMDALRVPDGEADVSLLSGGERRRVALCRLLLSEPDILLLDEPTNHLDAETVAWLQQHLQSYDGTVVAVTHDRYFLEEVAEWILELHHGEGDPYEGNYSGWLEQKRQRLARQEGETSARQQELARELEWVRRDAEGRREATRERITGYEELLRRDRPDEITKPVISIPDGPRLGKVVVDADGVAKELDDRLLFEDMDFRLPRGGIVGVVGPNGAGKTTLLRMIVSAAQRADEPPGGALAPDAGELTVGETVEISYVDQTRDTLTADNTVFEEISGGDDWIDLGGSRQSARAYTAAFGFSGSDQQKQVGVCSGGERNRIHLAKLLQSGGNLLLLDEPTNDLDVDTLRGLEEALHDFAGSAVVVSHDRWFLDRISTHTLAFEGNSEVVWYRGPYSEYEEDLKARRGEDAVNPRRIRYKPLTRP